MLCCDPYKLPGLYAHDQPIDTGILAEFDGTYQFRIWFNGSARDIDADFSVGDKLIIPIVEGDLNENYLYQAEIFDPFGELVQPGDKDCLEFQTFPLRVRCNPCENDDIVPYSYTS